MTEPTNFCEAYQAYWAEDMYPQTLFTVYIARLDVPENKAYWNSLSEAEQEDLDTGIFFYVYDADEMPALFDYESGNDFVLLKPEVA